MIFIGIDVDKKSFAFTVKDHKSMKRSKVEGIEWLQS